MATEPKRKSVKSETLTIRLDPKSRFMLEFVSRLRGQTITTVVERAIAAAADQAVIQRPNDTYFNWKDYWDVSDGVRALKLARVDELFPTYEEEKLYQFTRDHGEFFFIKNAFGGNSLQPGGPYIDILWPKIHEYYDIWEKTKTVDHWAVGKKMAADISAAGVDAPIWPPPPTVPAKSAPAKKNPLDDDIPF